MNLKPWPQDSTFVFNLKHRFLHDNVYYPPSATC